MLAVVQVALEGSISKRSAQASLAAGQLPQVGWAHTHCGSKRRLQRQGHRRARAGECILTELYSDAMWSVALHCSLCSLPRLCLRLRPPPPPRVQGDLIPWTVGQQFQDNDFPSLSGARIVRIAVHPDVPRAG